MNIDSWPVGLFGAATACFLLAFAVLACVCIFFFFFRFARARWALLFVLELPGARIHVFIPPGYLGLFFFSMDAQVSISNTNFLASLDVELDANEDKTVSNA